MAEHRHLATSSELLYRASDPEYFRWLAHVMPAAACSRPIRLRVDAQWHDTTGAPIGPPERVTDDMPDGVLYVACKNRRASVCPACAQTYRADTYHLIHAGLVGGKGVPDTVVNHPCLFATFAAPSFGPVHSVSKPGKPRLCRPRRTPETCPHGVRLACFDIHSSDDPMAGEPFCLDCYDYHHQAVWNLHAGELWRRTTIAAHRRLADLARPLGVKVRLSYAKVAEYQHRGAIHFHAMIRLDGIDPDDSDRVIAPPAAITPEHVRLALADAVASTVFSTDTHPRNRAGWPIYWGEQFDVRTVHLSPGDVDDVGQITSTAVAGYLAKYATKGTEDAGHVSKRLTSESLWFYTERDTHQARQLQACWYLGERPLACTTPLERDRWRDGRGTLPGWGKLQRWAHMLGYGGHFTTKSRRYSTTLTALREVRKAFQRGQQPLAVELGLTGIQDQDLTDDPSPVNLTYLIEGIGWRTTGDAALANTAAAMARERRRIAREEVMTMFNPA
jgi:hypothetical protein